MTVIAGLHHAEDDSAFMLPDCSEFALATNAKAVFDDQSNDANLEAYVKDVIEVLNSIARITAEVLSDFLAGGGMLDLADPAKQERNYNGRRPQDYSVKPLAWEAGISSMETYMLS